MIRCCRLFLVCWLLLSSSLSLFSRGAATTPEEVRARGAAARKHFDAFFNFMLFDAGKAASFNIVSDNSFSGYIGNRVLRQSIDRFKERTHTGVAFSAA